MKNHLHLKWNIETELCKLNLSKGFDPIRAKCFNLDFEKTTFKGGEPNIRISSKIAGDGKLIITQRFNKIEDLFDIVLAHDAAVRMGFVSIRLLLPYFPGARQDRVCNEGEALTAKVFAEIINRCNFDEVIILCPHSDVITALINNVSVIDEFPFIEEALRHGCKINEVNIVCPDAGAGKRTMKIVQRLSEKYPDNKVNLIKCEKVRDVKTGELSGFSVDCDDLQGLPTMIIDDINCMGGTFIGLSKILRQRTSAIVMKLVDGAPGVQKCPQCSTTIKDHAIKDRICFRCSPRMADAQLKAHNASQEPSESPTPTRVDYSNQNHVNAAYDHTEAYLRKACKESDIMIPEVFENWRIWFFSRGSALREWQRCLPLWLQGGNEKPVTDMTPNHTLERKIKERREATGSDGPRFRTVEEKANNLRGDNHVAKIIPYQGKPWTPAARKEPTIGRPTGMHGEEHLVI
jgi:ribose-phosphate pyrophosphokinase